MAEAEHRGTEGDSHRGPVAFSFGMKRIPRLPLPLQDVILIQPGFACLPRDQPAPVRQLYLGALPQVVAALAVAFDQCRAPGRSGFGENHVDLEASCAVRDVSLPVPRSPQKALANIPFDVEFVYVSFVLHFPPRDEDIGLVA